MKDELEAFYSKLYSDYMKTAEESTERLKHIIQNLAKELNQIWEEEIFSFSEKEYELDMNHIMDIEGISAMLLPDIEYNEYENFFNNWFSKTTLPESQIKEFCSSARKTVKEIVETTRDRFIIEIHKSLFPLVIYLSCFVQKIAEMCRNQK